jgi:hypothetical protein
MCYNLLAPSYATPSYYPHCPSWALDWSYRSSLILQEIVAIGADILCLQEVEMEHFELFFTPELAKQGYSGIHRPKSRFHTMGDDDRRFVDGCCIFWKSNRFDLHYEHLIDFVEQTMARESLLADHDAFSRLISKVCNNKKGCASYFLPFFFFFGCVCVCNFDSRKKSPNIEQDNIGLVAVLELKSFSTTGAGGKHSNPHFPPLHDVRASPQRKSSETVTEQYNPNSKYVLICNTHIHWVSCCCHIIHTFVLDRFHFLSSKIFFFKQPSISNLLIYFVSEP